MFPPKNRPDTRFTQVSSPVGGPITWPDDRRLRQGRPVADDELGLFSLIVHSGPENELDRRGLLADRIGGPLDFPPVF